MAKEAEAEIAAQIARAKALGIQPTHLDLTWAPLHKTRLFDTFCFGSTRKTSCQSGSPGSWFASIPFLPSLLTPVICVIDSIVSIDASVSLKLVSVLHECD